MSRRTAEHAVDYRATAPLSPSATTGTSSRPGAEPTACLQTRRNRATLHGPSNPPPRKTTCAEAPAGLAFQRRDRINLRRTAGARERIRTVDLRITSALLASPDLVFSGSARGCYQDANILGGRGATTLAPRHGFPTHPSTGAGRSGRAPGLAVARPSAGQASNPSVRFRTRTESKPSSSAGIEGCRQGIAAPSGVPRF